MIQQDGSSRKFHTLLPSSARFRGDHLLQRIGAAISVRTVTLVIFLLFAALPATAQNTDADAAAKALANANNPLANMVAFNIFIEPQFTVLHEGAGQPEFALFAALNLQFLPK